MSYNYIETFEDLKFLGNELSNKQYIGVDTEFRRTSKDNMKLALLQINDGEEIYIIDTVVLNDPKESCNFLHSKSVKKIFHSCKEDLEAVYSWTNKKMVNIFDTQLANAFLDGNYSVGYQSLVERKFDILIEKNETRSNWLRRPLSDSQLKYAVSDVEYLIYLYENQIKELSKSLKIHWLDQEMEKLIDTTFNKYTYSENIIRLVSKQEENLLLEKMNSLVEKIASNENINQTLFFSKKSQKDFLRLAIFSGEEEAFRQLTPWRKTLIEDGLRELISF